MPDFQEDLLTLHKMSPTSLTSSGFNHPYFLMEVLLILNPDERLWDVKEMVFCVFTDISTFFQAGPQLTRSK